MVEKFRLYMWVQERIVPIEVKMVGVLVTPLGINYLAHQNGMTVNGTYAGMTWNCIGWQSLLLLIISLVVGLQGNFTKISRLECILIGILGTFSVNILRMVFITLSIYYVNTVFAFLIHDYFAALTTIIWLFIFWWFSYSFVLEERA